MAQRVDPTPYGRHTLANVEGEPFYKGGSDLPATGRQDVLERLQRAEHHAVVHPNYALAPLLLNDLRIKQRGQGLLTICQPQFVKFLPHLHDWLTANSACIIAGAMTQHGHQNTQQSVANIAQGLAMALSLRPQSRIHAVAVSVALQRDSRHMIQRMAQAGVTPASHHHHATFATLLRDRSDPAVRAQHLIVSLGQGLGRFGKEPGSNFTSNPRERQHNRDIRWSLPLARCLSQSAQ
jgi:hypothetical protein